MTFCQNPVLKLKKMKLRNKNFVNKLNTFLNKFFYLKNLMQERKKNPSAFLRNIFQILQNTQLGNIIEWAPNGNGFVIKNLPQFESDILPQYFKHKKYSSFVRQLNMYGFHKQRNSMFDNCFVHDQFRRGEELPTDIKRKPEKKKKAGEQDSENVQKESDWLSFSKELRQFLPQIADSILAKNEEQRKKPIILTDRKNSQDQYQVSSQPIEQIQQEEEEYISKISLKGFIDEIEEEAEIGVKDESRLGQDRNQLCKEEQSSENEDLNESIKDECESEAHQSSEKRESSTLKVKHPENITSTNLTKEFTKSQESTIKSNELPTISMNFLENTLDSLHGLSQVLIRQNEILRKTHPLIRKMILSSQQNKIAYLNTEMEFEENESGERKYDNQKKLDNLLESQKEMLIELTEVLERQIEGLTEFGQQDLPLSNTSIRFRLEKSI